MYRGTQWTYWTLVVVLTVDDLLIYILCSVLTHKIFV